MKPTQIATTALFACVANAAVGAEITIVCPAELPANAMKIVTTPHGWQPFISSPLFLHSAGPIAGPPERLGQMVGETTRKTKTESTVEYHSLDAPYPEGVWFSCDYGEGNEFSIAKKLDAGIKSCVVKYKKGDKAGQNDLDIKCK
jgi:hypothetical protein